MAYIKKKGEFIGMGCLIQALGLAVCFLFWPIGIIILIIGGRMAIKYVCSDCGNKVEKSARICPVCKSELE